MIDILQFVSILSIGIALGWGATLYAVGLGFWNNDDDKLGQA